MLWPWHRFRGRARERQLDAEIRFHFEEHVRELIRQGRSPAAARREARLAIGGIEQTKEQVRDAVRSRWLEDCWQDTRFALRAFAREPSFTTVATLTLGLGIGAATAIFSVVYPVLLAPLPYPDPERLVSVTDRTADGGPLPVTFGTYRELTRRSRAFEGFAAHRAWRPTLTGRQEPERIDGQRVSADFFRTLGVQPALGAGFDPADDRLRGPDVIVLSDSLWRRSFGADEQIVGRVIRLDDVAMTVVGVMPRAFENVTAPDAQAWSLLQYDASLPSFDGREWGHHLGMIGRLREDVDLETGRRDLDEIAGNPLPEMARPAWASIDHGLAARRLDEAASAQARPVLLALLGAVALLLTIACVNMTLLLLARGSRRQGELTLRAALGAGRGRLLRQLLTESLLLAGLGGALGIVLGRVGVAGFVVSGPPELPRLITVGLDVTASAFALGVTTLIGTAAGLAPALGRGAGGRSSEVLRVSRNGRSRIRGRRLLVVAEVALAFVLLVGAGLMMRTVRHLFAIPPGFDDSGAVVMQVPVSGSAFADDEIVHRFFDETLEAVRKVPGVTSAAWTSQLPLSGDADVYGVAFEDSVSPPTDEAAPYRYAVSPGYFATMGIPLVEGRLLGAEDVAGATPAVVINASLAKRRFSDASAIGRRLHVGRRDLPMFTVVGVVGDVRQTSLDADSTDAAYVVPEQWYFADSTRWLVARADHNPLGLASALERAIWSVDDQQPIVRVQTLETMVARSESRRRFTLFVLEAFALLALVLAAVGLYGVLSGSVNERLPEIGVRSALGATRERILGLVIGQGLGLTAAGIVTGIGLAGFLSGALEAFLFGVSRLDPVTYLGVAVTLAVVAALASWLPAARAARVDPARTLRAG